MTVASPVSRSSWFQRFLLPGFALKAVIIGGGYATGRELAEYFVPAGPWGGLAAMLLATLICTIVAAITFMLARALNAYDYRSFFQQLLGRGWIAFEISYLIFVVLILAASLLEPAGRILISLVRLISGVDRRLSGHA